MIWSDQSIFWAYLLLHLHPPKSPLLCILPPLSLALSLPPGWNYTEDFYFYFFFFFPKPIDLRPRVLQLTFTTDSSIWHISSRISWIISFVLCFWNVYSSSIYKNLLIKCTQKCARIESSVREWVPEAVPEGAPEEVLYVVLSLTCNAINFGLVYVVPLCDTSTFFCIVSCFTTSILYELSFTRIHPFVSCELFFLFFVFFISSFTIEGEVEETFCRHHARRQN